MSDAPKSASRAYSYRLLRYSPAPASDEFFNIAALLYDEADRLIDARFAPDFDRMRCHPAVETGFLEALRTEFEEQRLGGEGFTRYLTQLERHLSTTLHFSPERIRLSVDDPLAEMDRLVATHLATPPGVREDAEAGRPGSRAAVRRELRGAFERAGLFLNGQGMQIDVEVRYLGRQRFKFDFGYETRDDAAAGYVHALGARNQMRDATQLAFVLDRLRTADGPPPSLDVVFGGEIEDEARELLAESRVELAAVGEADRLAERLRGRLGLS